MQISLISQRKLLKNMSDQKKITSLLRESSLVVISERK